MSMTNVNLAASTAQSVHFSTWSDNVLVDNSNGTAPVYVATDGTTASASNYNDIVPAGQVVIISNEQAKLDGLEFVGSGGLNMGTNPSGNGATAQTETGSLWADGYPTFVSLFSTAANTNLGVEQR